MKAHAELAYPLECCGVLLGRTQAEDADVIRVLPCMNTSATPKNHYEIAPQDLIGAQKLARDATLVVVGFYHSHPEHEAVWSQRDLNEAHWMGCRYVIVSVMTGKASECSVFRLGQNGEKSFAQEKLRVLPIQ